LSIIGQIIEKKIRISAEYVSTVYRFKKKSMIVSTERGSTTVFLNLFDIMEHQAIIFFKCGTPLKISLKKKGTQNMAISGNISNALNFSD